VYGDIPNLREAMKEQGAIVEIDANFAHEMADIWAELALKFGFPESSHGLNDPPNSLKRMKYASFPPVLHFLLQRAEFNPHSENICKVSPRYQL
jgi:hypothetical protein